MRAFKKYNNRGFTLIELMIVVAIVGVLAALAIYGVRKYLLNAKTAEARNAVGQMAKDAKSSYERESMSGAVLIAGTSAGVSNNVCASATKTVPAGIASVKGAKYQSIAAEWAVDQGAAVPTGFACLKFAVSDAQYYMYKYTGVRGGSGVGTFTANASGDLNGDGVVFSSFSLTGNVVADTVNVSPNIVEVNPEE